MGYLEFYRRCLKNKKLPNRGLCGCISDPLLDFFSEAHPDFGRSWYWGYDGNHYSEKGTGDEVHFAFTPLRQNIVLFMAAMNNEL